MRVLYIHQYFIGPNGAGGTRSLSLSRMFREAGHQVTILSGATNTMTGQAHSASGRRLFFREDYEGIEVLRLGLILPGYHLFAVRAATFLAFAVFSNLMSLRMPRPDVVFATSTPITVAIPALLLRRLRGVPFVFEVRDLWPDFPIQYGLLRNRLLIRLAYALERAAYHHAKAIVTTSPWMRDRIVEKGVDPAKVFCVPIGADVSAFRKDLAVRHDVRKALGLSDGELLVGYAGAHGIPNALDVIVEAASLLRSEPVHFLLVGDGRCKPDLQRRAIQLEISGKVHFWPPFPRDELAAILANVDLGVISARRLEAAAAILPNKLFDYLASGVPVLVNFKGDSADMLVRTGSGTVVEAESPEAVAHAIRRLSQERISLRRMGVRAREVAEKMFDRRMLYRSLVEIVESAARPDVQRVAVRP